MTHVHDMPFQPGSTPQAAEAASTHPGIPAAGLAAAHGRAVAAGPVFARGHVPPRPGPAGGPVRRRVYHDPVGHPFCLVTGDRPGWRVSTGLTGVGLFPNKGYDGNESSS